MSMNLGQSPLSMVNVKYSTIGTQWTISFWNVVLEHILVTITPINTQ